MIAALDVQYHGNTATTAMVVFGVWSDHVPVSEIVVEVSDVAEYVPGQFFQRELPCLLQAIAQCSIPLSTIVIDGYVWLDDAGRKGLGAKLFEALDQKTAIVGVAKTRFHEAPAVEVLRGSSKNPLFVTAAGMDVNAAAVHVKSMHGEFRIPTILRLVDQLARRIVLAADKSYFS